jgi:hypothetical protein
LITVTDEPADHLPLKTMQIGETNFLVTEPLPVDVVFADFYTELREANGMIYLTLAASVVDGANRPELRVVSRIRMPTATLANIQTGLEQIAKDIAKARETAN